MFKIKFPTKRIFWIFPILRINGMATFCNSFNASFSSTLEPQSLCRESIRPILTTAAYVPHTDSVMSLI